MPIERVDRPGESQEATGGKKRPGQLFTMPLVGFVFLVCLVFGFVMTLHELKLVRATKQQGKSEPSQNSPYKICEKQQSNTALCGN